MEFNYVSFNKTFDRIFLKNVCVVQARLKILLIISYIILCNNIKKNNNKKINI